MQQAGKGELMSVAELGRTLGLKKTDRYWLVHKNLFETTIFLGKIWIRRDSFENWYANQVKYRKVDGEEPGSELKKISYSVRDIAQMLGLHEATVYGLIRREKLETVTVDGRMRVPRHIFDTWYAGQERYRTAEDRQEDEETEAGSITMPEMAALLGIDRPHVYRILGDPRYKDIFEITMIAGRKRITRESFYRFLDMQDRYCLRIAAADATGTSQKAGIPEKEQDRRLSNFRQKKLLEGGSSKDSGSEEYLTVEEAALVTGVSRATITRWIREGILEAKGVGKTTRISREELDNKMEIQRHTQRTDGAERSR